MRVWCKEFGPTVRWPTRSWATGSTPNHGVSRISAKHQKSVIITSLGMHSSIGVAQATSSVTVLKLAHCRVKPPPDVDAILQDEDH